MKRLAVALCALLAASATPAAARPLRDAAPCVTYTGADGQWGNPANWSGDKVPDANDDACIPAGFVVVVSAPEAVNSLSAADASVLVTQDLAVGAGGATVGTLNLSGGVVSSAGGLVVGTLRWSGGRLDAAPISSTQVFLSGDLGGDGTLAIPAGGTAHVGADTTLAVPLTNDGQLFVDGGVLTLTGGSPSGSGSYQVAGGATLDWHAGSYALTSPTVSGTGVARVSGATLTVTGPARAGAPLAISGVARFAGALTAGSVTVGAGGTLELPGGAQLDALANAGTVRLAGGAVGATTYTEAAGATLAESLGGAALAVRGTATLAGTLAFDRGAGAIDDGASLPLIAYGSLTGGWATVAVAPLAGMSFGVVYGAGGASLGAHRVLPAPTPTPTPTPTPVPPPPPPPPKPGIRGVVAPDSGTVLVQASPGAPAKFVTLDSAATLPVGGVVDARKGQVTLTTASSFTNPKRPPTTVSVAGAIFQVRQTRAADGRTAVTDLIMKTPPGLAHACVPPHKGIVRTFKRVSRRTIRRIRVTAKGVVRAFGRVAVVTARNATFDLRDRCDGTAARLTKGRANLFDRLRGRSARLRARHTRIIRARLFTARRLHLKKVPKPRVP